MNKDQIKGRAKEMAGKMQKESGDSTDNRSKQAKGMRKESKGKMQKNRGDAKHEFAKDIDK